MSPRAAWRLEGLGFSAVYDYVAGKADWTAAGLPTDGNDDRRALPPYVRTEVATAQPADRLTDALRRASTMGTDLIVVTNAVGVVLGRIRTSKVADADGRRVDEVMEDGPATVRADENPHDLFERMRTRSVPAVIVTDPDGRLVGIIRQSDLASMS